MVDIDPPRPGHLSGRKVPRRLDRAYEPILGYARAAENTGATDGSPARVSPSVADDVQAVKPHQAGF